MSAEKTRIDQRTTVGHDLLRGWDIPFLQSLPLLLLAKFSVNLFQLLLVSTLFESKKKNQKDPGTKILQNLIPEPTFLESFPCVVQMLLTEEALSSVVCIHVKMFAIAKSNTMQEQQQEEEQQQQTIQERAMRCTYKQCCMKCTHA